MLLSSQQKKREKAQAAQETGWCKIRDAVVLPLVLQGAVYVVKTVLEKTVQQTA